MNNRRITYSECVNCEWVGPDEQLASHWPDIENITERCVPGEPVPSGECPRCGALCHPHHAVEPYPCPACGRTNVVWEEEIWEHRYVSGIDPSRTVWVSAVISTYDENGENMRFACRDCTYTWSVPKDLKLEFEIPLP